MASAFQYTRWLGVAAITTLLLAITALHFTAMFIGGILCAGIAGSCISVMSKMPAPAVSLSGDLDSHARRVF